MYFVGFGYPIVAPLVLYLNEGVTKSLAVQWDGVTDESQSIHQIASELVEKWRAPVLGTESSAFL